MMRNRFGSVVLVACSLLSASCSLLGRQEQEMPTHNSIQSAGEVTVAKNQTVYGIARQHGVSMRDLIVLNELKPPFTIKVGQTLLIPAKFQENAPLPMSAPVDAVETAEPSFEPAIDKTPVTSVPIEVPQELPADNGIKSVESPREAARKPLELAPIPPVKPLATTVVEKPPAPAFKPVQLEEAKEKPVRTETRAQTSAKLQWPVQGPIISSFGAKGNGVNNDGINIAAPKGAPVVAASGGIVAYAGNEMKGFGNLVLIRHEGGWVTAYAHLDRMMVARDAVVAPGEMIGTVGSTGGVSSPQLHFETRQEGKAVDPKTVISNQ